MSAAAAAGTPTVTRTPAAAGALAGTRALLRFALRRDRVRLPVWILALFLGTLSAAGKFTSLYADPQARDSLTDTMASPAGLAMTGPRHYLDDYTFGAMLGHQMLGFLAVLVGLMNVLVVTRHTRDEEETGRAELVRSAVVGRHAQLAAALWVAVVADLALALLLAAGLGATDLAPERSRARSSTASRTPPSVWSSPVSPRSPRRSPPTPGPRPARPWPSSASPTPCGPPVTRAGTTGCPGSPHRLGPALLPLRGQPLVAPAALRGTRRPLRRDGIRPVDAARRGRRAARRPARPPYRLRRAARPLGLALRLHRPLLAGFGAGLFLMGAMYGSVLGEADGMLKDIDQVQEALRRIGGTSPAESFASMIMVILTVVASVYVVTAALRPLAEEHAGRAEPLLATGLSRVRWAGGHLAVALGGGTALLLLGGLGIGITGAASTGDPGLVLSLTGAALAYAPALWVTAGIAAVLFGRLPRAARAAWTVPVYAFVTGYLGQLLGFPGWTNDLSPFGHVPRLPAAPVDGTPLTVLTLVAAALVLVGLDGFRRRDLETK